MEGDVRSGEGYVHYPQVQVQGIALDQDSSGIEYLPTGVSILRSFGTVRSPTIYRSANNCDTLPEQDGTAVKFIGVEGNEKTKVPVHITRALSTIDTYGGPRYRDRNGVLFRAMCRRIPSQNPNTIRDSWFE